VKEAAVITAYSVAFGVALIIIGVLGLWGPHVACLVGGVLVIVWAWLDYLGRQAEGTGSQ